MGITGLIPFLEKASKPTNVSEFSGGTAVIDTYCWLHKGVFSCAEKIARGDECDMYVSYCMKFVNMLLAKNVKPILVFDGQKLPAKMETEKKRRESRDQNRKKAAELMRLDRGNEAQTYLRRCIDITHEMALNLIRACQDRNVDCIVAPYEADAQLAFLNMQNLADVIVTEDSDLLLFGSKKVLFKMDINGNGLLVEQSKLHIAMGVKEKDFSLDKFRYMCILSGCDYLASLPGIGLVKACRFVTRTSDPDIYRALRRLSLHLNMPQLCVTKEYRDKFMEADFMFKYQPVYDPRKRCLRPLNDLDPQDENYVRYKNLIDANSLTDEQLKNLAYGNLDPFKLTQMATWSPTKVCKKKVVGRQAGWNTPSIAPHPSIWSENYVPNSWKKPKAEPPNALRAFCTTRANGEDSPAAETKGRRSIQITKKIVLPTTRLDVQFGNTNNKDGPVIEYSEDESENEITPPHTIDQSPSAVTSDSVNTLPKKNHHNPFLKSSSSTPAVKKNVSMLDKLQQLCRNTTSETEEVCSRYFGSNGATANISPKTPMISNNHQSPPTSPVISGRSKKTKMSIDIVDDDSQQLRSPLKALNGSSEDTEDDSYANAICSKYTLPSSGDENEPQWRQIDQKQKEVEPTRKRMIPFATTSTEKKQRAVGFLEKLNTFRRQSTNSFTWTQPKADEMENALNIRTSKAVTSDFKKPVTGCRTAPVTDSDKVLSQPSDEDEGFCSPDSFNENLNNSGAESSTESSSYPSPAPKPNWVSCRMSGLNRSGPKQLSLDQYAFKSTVKMKQ